MKSISEKRSEKQQKSSVTAKRTHLQQVILLCRTLQGTEAVKRIRSNVRDGTIIEIPTRRKLLSVSRSYTLGLTSAPLANIQAEAGLIPQIMYELILANIFYT